jgi:hypothetical protein
LRSPASGRELGRGRTLTLRVEVADGDGIEVRDEVWEVVEPLLPDLLRRRRTARERPLACPLTAIVFVLVTGIAWRCPSAQTGLLRGHDVAAPSRLATGRVWECRHQAMVAKLSAAAATARSASVVGGGHIRALQGTLTGPSQVDRGRTGSSHHPLVVPCRRLRGALADFRERSSPRQRCLGEQVAYEHSAGNAERERRAPSGWHDPLQIMTRPIASSPVRLAAATDTLAVWGSATGRLTHCTRHRQQRPQDEDRAERPRDVERDGRARRAEPEQSGSAAALSIRGVPRRSSSDGGPRSSRVQRRARPDRRKRRRRGV